jgi:hypothetical protein
MKCLMEIDEEKVDDMVLALLFLTTFDDKPGWRAGRVTTGMPSIVPTRKDSSLIRQLMQNPSG